MQRTMIALGSMLSFSICVSVMAQENPVSNSMTYQEAAGLLHDSANERNAIESAMAPIKSRAQLERYLRDTPRNDSPLAKLFPQAQSRFINRLHSTRRA